MTEMSLLFSLSQGLLPQVAAMHAPVVILSIMDEV